MTTIISLTVLGILVLFLGAMKRQAWLLPVILFGMAAIMALTLDGWNDPRSYFGDMIVVNNTTIAFSLVMIFSAFLIFSLASHYYRGVKRPLEDIYGVMIFALVGAVEMVTYGNLILLFLGIETLSIALYVLAGSHKEAITSNEATLKYFLLGSFLSGFLLFGIALIYGSAGSFSLQHIALYVQSCQGVYPPMFLAGIFLLIIGFAFKMAVAPFHFWAPDVYEGTPTLLTAFMATVVKTASVVALYRFFAVTFQGLQGPWETTIAVMAALTILLGNFTGIYQPGLKRMLAYSSISHSGYMLLAVLALGPMSSSVLLLYTLSYSLATILAFGVLILVREAHGHDGYDTLLGLRILSPSVAVYLTVAMFSLTGIPPLAGFMAKYYLFLAAIDRGLLWLVLVAIAGSAVSAVYYFRPVIAMYLRPSTGVPLHADRPYRIHLLFMALLVILIGILPFLVIGVI